MEKGREFHFTEQDFETVCKLLYDQVGISLNRSKLEMVYSRLARRLRANNLNTFSDYLDLIQQGNHVEREAFINALTTNLTAFFREPHHFPILAEHVRKIGNAHPISLWCAASSTGEEAYSMAMTAVEVFGSVSPPVKILASDVDTSVLEKARTGIYSLAQVEKMPQDRLKKFFTKGMGKKEGLVKIKPDIAKLVTFRQINLLEDNWLIRGPFDAIFCRNVMIYFDKPTQLRILQKFIPLLRPDGLLFTGPSESFHHAASLFRLRGKAVYELASAHV